MYAMNDFRISHPFPNCFHFRMLIVQMLHGFGICKWPDTKSSTKSERLCYQCLWRLAELDDLHVRQNFINVVMFFSSMDFDDFLDGIKVSVPNVNNIMQCTCHETVVDLFTSTNTFREKLFNHLDQMSWNASCRLGVVFVWSKCAFDAVL